MHINDFVALLKTHAAKTSHIRISEADHWIAALNPMPHELTNKTENLVMLIQKNIEQGRLCDKNKEYLLIFCCDPVVKDKPYCLLRILIRPLTDINNANPDNGKSLSLYINYAKAEIMNDAKAISELGLAISSGSSGSTQAISYGNYNNSAPQLTAATATPTFTK